MSFRTVTYCESQRVKTSMLKYLETNHMVGEVQYSCWYVSKSVVEATNKKEG